MSGGGLLEAVLLSPFGVTKESKYPKEECDRDRPLVNRMKRVHVNHLASEGSVYVN
ncbi:hypothetical protein QJS10_CPA05g02362 [Acorus calamus]|uniref:Uncharacterized protein n=1 Tax=Acorus calamus TaxID=4465 RepID=A0AAV9EXG9_ACOCL|nr:hypothetical protein QJS10_CPA05g02362 [Acorus calamus]